MSKIVSMSSGAIDPIAQTKRVFWTPVTTTTILKVGQPVCYSSDSVLDHKGRATDPTHIGLTAHTYAQGAQDFTGRLFVVEEPLTVNLMSFAGIVKSLGPKAGAIGDMIEIFVPNGAILPCWIDASVTQLSTVLGIRNGEADLSYPGRPIGVAQETINRTTPGMCWVKIDPNMFLYQSGTASTSLTGAVINTLQHTFIATSGSQANLMVHTTISGDLAAAHNEWGVLDYMAVTGSITAAGYTRGLLCQLNLAGATLNSSGACLFGAHAQIHGAVTNTEVQTMAALAAEWSCSEAPDTGVSSVLFLYAAGAENVGSMIHFASAGEQTDYIFNFQGLGGAGSSNVIKKISGEGAGGMWTNTGKIVAIKIRVGDTDYHIPAGENLALV